MPQLYGVERIDRHVYRLRNLLLIVTIAMGLAWPGSGRLVARQNNPAYSEIFYKSGRLQIQAYLYKPARGGPFPLIIYNHGSRDGQERVEQPVPFIGRVLPAAGYAVLVPERRGYGKSDGEIFRQEVGLDTGAKFISRLQAETGDVLA